MKKSALNQKKTSANRQFANVKYKNPQISPDLPSIGLEMRQYFHLYLVSTPNYRNQSNVIDLRENKRKENHKNETAKNRIENNNKKYCPYNEDNLSTPPRTLSYSNNSTK